MCGAPSGFLGDLPTQSCKAGRRIADPYGFRQIGEASDFARPPFSAARDCQQWLLWLHLQRSVLYRETGQPELVQVHSLQIHRELALTQGHPVRQLLP